MSSKPTVPEPVTRRTWLLALLAFVLMWAWVLVAQDRVEARHPVTTGPSVGYNAAAGRLASRG